jgi:predicted nucleotidyltransferase
MATLDLTIEKIRERYPYLSREYGIRKIGLFGSVAKKTERIDSDIDIVVEFAKPILSLIRVIWNMTNLRKTKNSRCCNQEHRNHGRSNQGIVRKSEERQCEYTLEEHCWNKR